MCVEFQNLYNITRTRAKVSPICARAIASRCDLPCRMIRRFLPGAETSVSFREREPSFDEITISRRIVEAQHELELLSPGRFVTHGSGSVS